MAVEDLLVDPVVVLVLLLWHGVCCAQHSEWLDS